MVIKRVVRGPTHVIWLAQMTPEQLASYRRIWGEFMGMEFVFGGPAGMFAFYGHFGVSPEGEISLTSFLAEHVLPQLVELELGPRPDER